MFRRVTLESGAQVRNIVGTSACSPVRRDSWKQFYKSCCTWPRSCRVLGCGGDPAGGAHVKIKWIKGVWIIPMCARHNNPTNTEWMSVNEDTVAVYIHKENTTGPEGICRE